MTTHIATTANVTITDSNRRRLERLCREYVARNWNPNGTRVTGRTEGREYIVSAAGYSGAPVVFQISEG